MECKDKNSRVLLSAVCCLLSAVLISCATISVEEQKKAEFHYKMGVSYMREGNTQPAFVELQKAVHLDPNNKEILNSLGLVYLEFNELEKAKHSFIRAITIEHGYSDAHNNLGVTYLKNRQWGEAIASFERALSNTLYQTPETAYYNLGITYYMLKQYDAAITSFKNAITRAPLYHLPYYRLAICYNKTGRYGDAAAMIARAIEIDPEYKGNRQKFIEDMKQRLLMMKGDEDIRDYLEIMKY